MQTKRSIKTLVGSAAAMMAACMSLLCSTPVLAANPTTGSNITSQTIPVTAEINTYYEIVMPANLNGNGGIDLTRDYNAYLKSDGDTTSTFYGYTSVGMKGVIDSTKKVTARLTCADMADTSSHTAPVGIRALTTDQSTIATQIWAGHGSNTNKITFGSAAWTAGTSGLNIDFTSAEVNDGSTTVQKYGMLRTTLPVNGVYTSNLVIDFSLQSAS